jgi:protease-4
MKTFLITLAAVFAGLLLFFIAAPFVLISLIAASARPVPPPIRAVLTLDLRQPLSDQTPSNPLAFLSGRALSVVSAVERLRRAEHDDHVKALYLRLPEGGIAPASADELEAALRRFRASGRPILAFSQGIFPSGVPSSAYLLGAASGEFWMQPNASLQSVGAAREEMFFKRAFDKYGVTADYEQRAQYKNAVNPFLYDDYTPAHREAELGWLSSVYASELAQAAEDRRQAPAALRSSLEKGPYSAEQAQSLGLIDHVGEEHEAELKLTRAAGDGAKLVDLASYRPPEPALGSSAPRIAVIGAEGDIVTGSARSAGFGAQSGVYSDDVSKAFYDAIADHTIKAIVFRVSSPGGSDTASEQILAALNAAKAAGKPVVVSMGAYAASGGYWISSQASEIIAQPTTLTGSIGVFGGKFVLGPALARFGVDTHGLSVGGDYASAFGSEKPFTPDQRAQFSQWMDRIYATFVARVAEGRRLPLARVQDIAKGRVWTGVQAKDLGLVDRLGGFHDAVIEAARLGGLRSTDEVRLVDFPAVRSPLEALQRMMGAGGTSLKTMAAVTWILGDPKAQSLLDAVVQARLGPEASAALSPSRLP